MSLVTSTLEFTLQIKVWLIIEAECYLNHNSAGNVVITSLKYESVTQTIVCTSSGGPVTNVLWSKDDSSILNDGQNYELHKRIINETSATYENRLRILDASSIASGTYTCTVNNSLGSMQRSLSIEGKMWHDSRYLQQMFPFSVQGCGTEI